MCMEDYEAAQPVPPHMSHLSTSICHEKEHLLSISGNMETAQRRDPQTSS